MDLHRGSLLVPIPKVILTLRGLDLIVRIFLLLTKLVVALGLSVPRARTRGIVVHLACVVSITVLARLLVGITIVLARLLRLVVPSANGPLTASAWLVVDFNACFVVLRVVVLVHHGLPVMGGPLSVSLCSLLCTQKLTISFLRGA